MAEEFTLTHHLDGEVLVIRTNGYLNDLGAEKVDLTLSISISPSSNLSLSLKSFNKSQ
ncbi:MAG: hypothetical protein J6Z11_16575 [Candidatus Riflebacteria bacterium]|nr:hypothetical protein [Candidatus Riflebacteria bacterium]